MIQEYRKLKKVKKEKKKRGRMPIPKDVSYTVREKTSLGQFTFTKQGKEKLKTYDIQAEGAKYRWALDSQFMRCYFRNGEEGQFPLRGDPKGKKSVQMSATHFYKNGMKKAIYFDFHHNTSGDFVELDNGEKFYPDFFLTPSPPQPIPNENIHRGRAAQD